MNRHVLQAEIGTLGLVGLILLLAVLSGWFITRRVLARSTRLASTSPP